MHRRDFLRLSSAAAAYATACPFFFGQISKNLSELSASDFHAARRFLTTSQGRISHLDIGKGPAALFLHGFPLNSFQWRGVLPQLAKTHRCIAPDFLGLGYTEVAEGQEVTPQAQVAMLAELLDKLSIADVDIVANDSGGAVAQLFSVHYPHRVKSLLLTNCDTEPDSPPQAVAPVIELGRKGRFADEWLAPWVADKPLARSEIGLGGMCYANPQHPGDDAIDTYLTPLVSSEKRKKLTNAYAAALAPNPLAGISAKLKTSSIATRVLWGTGDTIFSQQSPQYFHATVGNSLGYRLVPGAKLFFPEEMPSLIVEEAEFVWSL